MFICVLKPGQGYFFFFLDVLSFPSINRWPCFFISAREGT